MLVHVDVHADATIDHATHHTREVAAAPADAAWVAAQVAAGDLGPYPAQVACGYHRRGGFAFARFRRDIAWWIALDWRCQPTEKRPSEGIRVTGEQVELIRHPGTGRERVEPLTTDPQGWWHIDGDAWPWTLADDEFGTGREEPPLSQTWGPDGEQRCTVCHAVNEFDGGELPSMVGYGYDTWTRCRALRIQHDHRPDVRRAPQPRAVATVPAAAARAGRASPARHRRRDIVVTAPHGEDEYWPDEHDSMPAAWWRMPDDIRLQVRIGYSERPELMFTSDLYDSLNAHGPLYVNLAHLTRWDTYQRGEQPTRTARRALTGQFPGQFATVHHTHHPGTVSLALRLHRLTDAVAEAILAHRHTTLTALGLDPTSPFGLRMP